jgi:hypothetical protein
MVNLLLVLNFERIGRQYHFYVACDFLARTLVKASQDPGHFENRNQADESRFFFGEPAGYDFRRAWRLRWIILGSWM